MDLPLDDETLQRVYGWIDEIPLSRPKKNIARDFSDGILFAEVIRYYFPKLVQMHNYSAASSVKQKQYNWTTLNRKVLKRLQLHLTKEDIDDLVSCRAGAVEHILVKLQLKIASYKEKRPSSGTFHEEEEGEDPLQSPLQSSQAGSFGTISRNSLHSPVGDKYQELREPTFQQMNDSGHERMIVDGSTMNSVPMGFHTHNTSSDVVIQGLKSDLVEKDQTIADLRETVQILEMKVQKLEQLVRLKDGKIQTLVAKLRSQKPQ